MKLATFDWRGHVALGALANDQVVDLHRAYQVSLSYSGGSDKLVVAGLLVPADHVGLLRRGEGSLREGC
jgi:hypothetical protein